MAEYNIEDLVGKTLYAKKSIALKRITSESATTVYTVPSGDVVGVVYSWVSKPDGSMWWQFYDTNNIAYYALHAVGNFDLDSLTQQGLETIVQKAQEAAKANESLADKIERNLKWIVGAAVVAYIGKQVINKKL